MQNKKKVFAYDSATGSGTDTSTDPFPTKDPNDYLAPRIDKMPLINVLIIVALILGIAFLYIQVVKQAKTF
jgi:hypothetical protein